MIGLYLEGYDRLVCLMEQLRQPFKTNHAHRGLSQVLKRHIYGYIYTKIKGAQN